MTTEQSGARAEGDSHLLDEVVVISVPTAAELARPIRRDALLRRTAAGLFVATTAAVAGVLFQPADGGRFRVYQYLLEDMNAGITIAALLGIVGLLLSDRHRDLGAGLAVAAAVAWVTVYLPGLQLSKWEFHTEAMGKSLALGGYVAMALGGILAWGVGPAERGALAPKQSWRVRGAVLATGVAGAVAWFVGECLNWERITSGIASVDGSVQVTTCCTLNQKDAWTQASVISCGVGLLILALAAVLTRSRMRGAGLLAGALVVLVLSVAGLAVQALAPIPATYGPQAAQLPAGYMLSYSILGGYWLTVAGMVLLVVAGVLRTVLGRRPADSRTPAPEISDAPAGITGI